MKQKVYLGLSGGVDSAVAAALLLEQGYDVQAVFLKIWSDDLEDSGQCPWVQDRQDALAIAAKLNIPLQTVDFEKEYKTKVFAYFLSEYKAGRTPNPDILCNEVIKFGVFLEWAIKQGADYIATGHHVRRLHAQGNSDQETYHLLTGIDELKDQSYFLCRLNQFQLAHTLFPIGDFTKAQVRAQALTLGLTEVADKRSTRGICFIGNVDLQNFLSKYTQENPGQIIDEAGKVIGRHNGVSFYTIGQRKNLQIPATTPLSKPYFVLEKRPATNELVVSNDLSKLQQDTIYCQDLHWLDGKIRKFPMDCQIKIRSGQKMQPAVLDFTPDLILQVKLTTPVTGVAPGQFVALYQDQELLGSAIIA